MNWIVRSTPDSKFLQMKSERELEGRWLDLALHEEYLSLAEASHPGTCVKYTLLGLYQITRKIVERDNSRSWAN